jgi:hypothetical protein
VSAWLWAALLLGQTTLDAGERVSLPVAINSPTGEGGRIGLSDIIRSLDGAIRASTDLEVEPLDPGLLDVCDRRLACLVEKSRPDYSRERLRNPDGSYQPYRAHVFRLRDQQIAVPRLMLVVTHVTLRGQPDRLSIQAVHTDIALEVVHDTARQPGWERRIESRLFERAVLGSVQLRASSVDELNRRLPAALSDLQDVFRRLGHDRPFGSIAMRGPPTGATLSLDDRVLGATAGDTTVVGVRAGSRTLKLEHPEFESAAYDLRVQPSRVTTLDVALIPRASASSRTLRDVTRWTGVATVAAGIGVLAYAATRPSPTIVCFSDCGNDGGFIGSGGPNGGLGPATTEGRGVLLAPLGGALVGAGLGWSVGTLTFERRADVPWLSWLIGAGAGAAIYGVASALE